jgi:hypothetical protein
VIKLENWSIVFIKPHDYAAPELIYSCLKGNVYNHPKFEGGKYIKTSKLRKLNSKERTAETFNTEYSLGEPDKKWVDWLDANGYNIEEYIIS